MWFQTLKTRQSVRSFSTKNSQGLLLGLEYTDRKAEIHTLKRETTPLSLEEGSTVAFATHENGAMSLLAISQCGKGKSCIIELRAWNAITSLGFTAKEITAQDPQGNVINDGKFKALVNLPETLPGTHLCLKVDALKDFVVLAVSSGLIIMWRCRQVENVAISLELFSVMKSPLTIQDVALTEPEKSSKKGPPSVVVGEPGGIRMFTALQQNDPSSEDGEVKFLSSLVPFPSPDIGNTVQDIQHASPSCCILSDSLGRLWYLNPPLLQEIMLPSTKGEHGIFAVQPKQGQAEGWLATIDRGQTLNLFRLSDAINSTETGSIAQPWHTIMPSHPLSILSFIEVNTLAAASNSNKSISIWVGIDNIGTSRLESG